uniref:Uncharacterized protein n=1 Tax=Moniliophthora roreri TaxID=221103 RepID=A0A0W0G6M4_MONRR
MTTPRPFTSPSSNRRLNSTITLVSVITLAALTEGIFSSKSAIKFGAYALVLLHIPQLVRIVISDRILTFSRFAVYCSGVFSRVL